MDRRGIAAITNILNQENFLNEKKMQIREARSKRRGVNRHLYLVIEDLLSDYNLPIRPEDALSIYVLNDASEEVYLRLRAILQGSHCNYFNAVCGEILWEHFHDKSFADMALAAYYHELSCPSCNNEYHFAHMCLSICRIYSKYKSQDFDFSSFCSNAINYVAAHLNDSGYLPLFILKGLLKCKECTSEVERTLTTAIEYYREINDHSKCIDYMSCMEKHYSDEKRSSDAQKLRCEMAQEYEKAADTYDWFDSSSAHLIIGQIHSAMNMWSRANVAQSSAERQRLAKRIQPIKQLALEKMQYFQSDPIDLSSSIESMRELIKNSSFERIIANLAYITPLQSIEDLEAKLKQDGFMFSSLFATTVVDGRGRIRCIIPAASNPTPQEKYAILEHRAAEQYSMVADAFIQRYLWLAKEKTVFTAENLRFLVDNNAFIPTDRSESFLKGLVAGFELDLVTAMSILMPQIENAIRCLAEECGAVVYKTSPNGVEECLSLESILRLPEVEACLDENFLFNLKLFFTSDYGYGMRNIISHGLNSDREIQSAHCLAVWWFVLHVCCIFSSTLYKRLLEEHSS